MSRQIHSSRRVSPLSIPSMRPSSAAAGIGTAAGMGTVTSMGTVAPTSSYEIPVTTENNIVTQTNEQLVATMPATIAPAVRPTREMVNEDTMRQTHTRSPVVEQFYPGYATFPHQNPITGRIVDGRQGFIPGHPFGSSINAIRGFISPPVAELTNMQPLGGLNAYINRHSVVERLAARQQVQQPIVQQQQVVQQPIVQQPIVQQQQVQQPIVQQHVRRTMAEMVDEVQHARRTMADEVQHFRVTASDGPYLGLTLDDLKRLATAPAPTPPLVNAYSPGHTNEERLSQAAIDAVRADLFKSGSMVYRTTLDDDLKKAICMGKVVTYYRHDLEYWLFAENENLLSDYINIKNHTIVDIDNGRCIFVASIGSSHTLWSVIGVSAEWFHRTVSKYNEARLDVFRQWLIRHLHISIVRGLGSYLHEYCQRPPTFNTPRVKAPIPETRLREVSDIVFRNQRVYIGLMNSTEENIKELARAAIAGQLPCVIMHTNKIFIVAVDENSLIGFIRAWGGCVFDGTSVNNLPTWRVGNYAEEKNYYVGYDQLAEDHLVTGWNVLGLSTQGYRELLNGRAIGTMSQSTGHRYFSATEVATDLYILANSN